MLRFESGNEWFSGYLGLNRAVLYTLLARLGQIISSIGTVLLIIRFMSPIAQGYYYTLLSLAALQIVFELGFSMVILQLAAHESASLVHSARGEVRGDPVAHQRLASILQLTVRWYLRASVALVVILLPLGVEFFSRKGMHSQDVAWFGPWATAVVAVSVNLFLTPIYSFIEGCNQVQQVALLRMCQSIAVMMMSWGAIASGHGLYACALVNTGSIFMGLYFLARRGSLLSHLMRFRPSGHAVSWRKEIWPFQWRTGVSYLCSYFTVQIFTPILFASRSPQEAGRFGLSLSITAYLPVVALCWISTKAAPFGQLVRLGKLRELDTLFLRTLRQALVLIFLMAVLCFSCVVLTQRVFPRIAARMESPAIFILLLLTAIGTFVVQSIGVYMRSFKREPYLFLSTAIAAFTLASVFSTARHWGAAAVSVCYFCFSGLMAFFWALVIFRRRGLLAPRAAESLAGPLPDPEDESAQAEWAWDATNLRGGMD